MLFHWKEGGQIAEKRTRAKDDITKCSRALLKMHAHLSAEESEELSRQGIEEEKQDILLGSMYAVCRKAEKGDMTALTFLLDVSGIRPKNTPAQSAPIGDIALSLTGAEQERNAP